jgi:hypothetical protein
MPALKPKYIQVNCIESDSFDYRQADAVKKYKPDIILLEYPNQNTRSPNRVENNFPPGKKPLDNILATQKHLHSDDIHALCPWAKSDIKMWDNLMELWKQNHECLVYSIDAPHQLISEFLVVWKNMYPSATRNWLWWVQICLREAIMTNHFQWVLSHYRAKTDPTILVFLQSFHYRHVKFLLKNPTPEAKWNYYFGKFPEITPQNIGERIKQENKLFYRYWTKFWGK